MALPAEIDPDAAVAIPNYEVACALLNEAARGLNPRSVYVNGVAGGVGCAIVHLCHAAGIEIIAGVNSAVKCAFCVREGAIHTNVSDAAILRIPCRFASCTGSAPPLSSA